MNTLRTAIAALFLAGSLLAQPATPPQQERPQGAPVILDGDTLFLVRANLGPFTPEQRAGAIAEKLGSIVKTGRVDSVVVAESSAGTAILADTVIIMVVTGDDAALVGINQTDLAREYAATLRDHMNGHIQRYSPNSLLTVGAIAAGLLVALGLAFWAMSGLFPRLYVMLESWEGRVFLAIRIRSREILSAGALSSVFIILAKGVRLALSLAFIYFFLTYTLALFPWTQKWNVKPVLIGIFLTILTTAAAVMAFRGLIAFFAMMIKKVDGWKGTVIKSVKLRTIEILSEDRIAEMVEGGLNILKLILSVALAYVYVTILFSFFPFTQTWAGTLFGYIVNPLWNLFAAFIAFLPNLFFILVIVYVTRYVIKFIRLIFDEIGKGSLALPGFYREWADPTYKIVRFLILAFAAIVIFPYLPGSDSPIFQGVSVFLGILFSLGSTSAISNVVSGIVLTYMRPFKVGDRVKIADTVGDVRERTLLVTRVRTIKNVEITIPNAMVLGSHIINFSTSAKDPGLILHTGVTISYDVPWKTAHGLLIAAAEATDNILNEPRPFVLQTSLNDFSVVYELNAYTDQPNVMATTYSDLHKHIQDRFNEAGVEIMSPHYTAVRDGNQAALPDEYLPRSYQAPAFRVFSSGSPAKKTGKPK
jgi:small-conductance mechanosensitive channel